MKRMQQKRKMYTTVIMAFLTFSIILATMPMANAAGAITLTPTAQAPGSSVTVQGANFGIYVYVGIGFGAEVKVINETLPNETGPYDVGGGPYITYLSHVPIKPGSYRKAINLTSTLFYVIDTDNGNGTFTSTATAYFVNGTIDYVTGKITLNLNTPRSSSTHYVGLANYTYYEYNVTPAARVATLADGTFSASIVVPSVATGGYNVTAVDTEGHIATARLIADVTIPENLTVGVMVLLSTVAVIVSTRYFRKRPKIKSYNPVKL
jgi:hypothetical protein